MRRQRGFTLIETLIATLILVCGLAAVAIAFSYSIRATLQNRQQTATAVLLHDKLEELKAAPFHNPAWTPGGSLDPAAPAAGYFDFVELGEDGTVLVDTAGAASAYLRVWQIDGGVPRKVTVAVFARRAGFTDRTMELARATTLIGPSFEP